MKDGSPAAQAMEFEKMFDEAWHLNQGDSQDEKEHPAFWDSRAPEFAAKAHSPESRAETEQLLDRFSWDPAESVLDIGAGPGTFAIPLARRVREVTALDISAPMLAELEKQAAGEGVSNLVSRCARWLDAPDLQAHDTIICFNAFGMAALARDHQSRALPALRKMRDMTRRRLLVLIPHADSPADPEMRRALKWPGGGGERRRIGLLYLLFTHLEMLPDLTILKRPFHWTFNDLDEAVSLLARKIGLPQDPALVERLRGHLKTRLVKGAQGFSLAYPVSQALFVWEREG